MSGIVMAIMGGAGGAVQGGNQTASSVTTGSGSSTASVTFNSDGTTTGFAGAHQLGWSVTVSNWWSLAPDSTVGSRYWISLNSGAWTGLSSGSTTVLTGTNSSSSTGYRIAADSGGASIVGTGTINLSVANQV